MKLQRIHYSDVDSKSGTKIKYRYASLKPFENDVIEELHINLDKETWKISDNYLLDVGKTVFNLFYDDDKLRSQELVESGIELDNVFYYTNAMLREDKLLLIDIKILSKKEKIFFLEYRAEQNNLN